MKREGEGGGEGGGTGNQLQLETSPPLENNPKAK